MRGNRWTAAVAGLILGSTLAFPVLAEDPPTEPPKPESILDASDPSKGFVTFKSGDNSLTLGAWGQFRATAEDKDEYDADTAGSGIGIDDGTTVAFSVHKVRPYIQGTVFKSWFKYRFEFEIGPLRTDAANNQNNSRVTDAFVEIAKWQGATFRAGQWKVPFGLQELTSDTRQEFVDRTIVNAKFTPSRDIGVMLYGYAWDRKFGYQAGVFNGSGQNNPQEDRGFMYAGRVWIDPLGEYKMFESANDHTAKNILHFGIGARTGEAMKGTGTPGVFQDVDNEWAVDLEIAWRWSRLWAMGEYFIERDAQQNPTVGPDVAAEGWHVQLGFMVHPTQHEIAVRYAHLEPDTNVDDANQQELRLVYGYYIKGHNLKIQTDIGEVSFGENFATLGPVALRFVTPGLEQPRRLATLPGTELKDKQARIQLTVQF